MLSMNTAKSQAIPAPPNLIRSLTTGFEAIASHLSLLLFPILLDLFLWFGPRLRIVAVIQNYLLWVERLNSQQPAEITSLMEVNRQLLEELAQHLNIFSALRSLPVGVPSLMAGRAVAANPLGKPALIDLPSWGAALIVFIIMTLIGLGIASLYFTLVAQAALSGKLDWREALKRWPWSSFQLLQLIALSLGIAIALIVPLSCIYSFLLMGGADIGKIFLFLYGIVVFWLLFPLVLSPLGIFAFQDKLLASISRGVRLARMTMTNTLLLVLGIIVLSFGLDMLWMSPKETSWMAMVGVLGHAFVAASLLATCFVYYRDADHYVSQKNLSSKVAGISSD
jgi:hypothetical protein